MEVSDDAHHSCRFPNCVSGFVLSFEAPYGFANGLLPAKLSGGSFIDENCVVPVISKFGGKVSSLCHVHLHRFNKVVVHDQDATMKFFLPVFAGITLVVGVVAGAYPAFILSGFRPVAALQGGDRTGSRRALLRKTLVITQFTISIFLIIGTAVAYDQFNFLSNTKLGFENEQVAVIRINNSAVKEKYQAFKHELMQNPNILDVSATANLLGGSDWGMPVFVESADGEKKEL